MVTSLIGRLSTSVSEYTLQTSLFATCLAIIPGVAVLHSKSTHSQLFPMTIPPELCNLLLCWSSFARYYCNTHCSVPATQITTTGKSPHIPATPQQFPSHCNGPSAWLIAFAGFYTAMTMFSDNEQVSLHVTPGLPNFSHLYSCRPC